MPLASIASDIREYFVRHFLGRVQVHNLSTEIKFHVPEILSVRREIATHPIRTQMQVRSSELLALNNLKCHSGSFRFAKAIVNVHGEHVRRYVPKEIIVAHVPLMNKRARPKSDLKRMILLPQERPSRLKWQHERPKLVHGESVLAWYGPIIEGAVIKMTLNRQSGTLLVWYDPRSRRFEPHGLYLCRRFGVAAQPEWRWV